MPSRGAREHELMGNVRVYVEKHGGLILGRVLGNGPDRGRTLAQAMLSKQRCAHDREHELHDRQQPVGAPRH